MKNEYYQIGEVSKITGLSKDTLHFYTKIGLLTPDYIDPDNQYRYYSRWNLWQLDIITVCRKLSVPLEKVKQLLSCRDNEKIIALLMEYRKEALDLSRYYQQVADDILWYNEEQRHIQMKKDCLAIEKKWLSSEAVIIGGQKRSEKSYHANLQEAAKDALRQSPSIRRKYGYILDMEAIPDGKFVKRREYLKMEQNVGLTIPDENRFVLPGGPYAVFTLHIQDEKTDFSPLIEWLRRQNEETDMIFAEELGLQLFDYLGDYYCEIKAHLKT